MDEKEMQDEEGIDKYLDLDENHTEENNEEENNESRATCRGQSESEIHTKIRGALLENRIENVSIDDGDGSHSIIPEKQLEGHDLLQSLVKTDGTNTEAEHNEEIDERGSLEEDAVGGPIIKESEHEAYDSDDEIDLFMATGVLSEDDEGNNELHIYPKELAYEDESIAEQFHDITASIDKAQMQAAINKRNIFGKTPLVEFLEDDKPGVVWSKADIRIPLFNTLLELGSDVNATDNLKISAVYKIVEKVFDMEELTELKMLRILLDLGTDIDKGDIFGRTPISLSRNVQLSQFLIENGADVNIVDNWGRNLVHEAVKTSYKDIDLVKFYIDTLGTDVVNNIDIFGSTPLHYASIFQGNVSEFLINQGADVNAKDSKGQTPLHIAAIYGKNDVFDLLVSKGGDLHAEDNEGRTPVSLLYPSLCLVKQSSVNSDQLADKESIFTNIVDPFESKEKICSLLHNPSFGGVRDETESKEIQAAVVSLAAAMCEYIGQLDERFTCTLFRTGSSEEGTKVGQPNEFDFVFCLEKFSEVGDIEEVAEEKGFAVFRAHDGISDEFGVFFDENKLCVAEHVRSVFGSFLRQIVCDHPIWSNPNLFYDGHVRHASDRYRPVFTLTCGWIGTTYKNQFISVDIVPAIRKKGWWPPSTDVTKIGMMSQAIQDEGCLLLFQSFDSFMRISCAPAEISLMKSLPRYFRQAYRLCKLLRHEAICPEKLGWNVDDVVTSYMFKNSLFHILEDCKEEGLLDIHPPTDCKKEEIIITTQPSECNEEGPINMTQPTECNEEGSINMTQPTECKRDIDIIYVTPTTKYNKAEEDIHVSPSMGENFSAFQQKPRDCSLKQAAVKRSLLKSDDLLIIQIAVRILRFFGKSAQEEKLPFYFFSQMDEMFSFEMKQFEDNMEWYTKNDEITSKCKSRLAYAKVMLYVLGEKF